MMKVPPLLFIPHHSSTSSHLGSSLSFSPSLRPGVHIPSRPSTFLFYTSSQPLSDVNQFIDFRTSMQPWEGSHILFAILTGPLFPLHPLPRKRILLCNVSTLTQMVFCCSSCSPIRIRSRSFLQRLSLLARPRTRRGQHEVLTGEEA